MWLLHNNALAHGFTLMADCFTETDILIILFIHHTHRLSPMTFFYLLYTVFADEWKIICIHKNIYKETTEILKNIPKIDLKALSTCSLTILQAVLMSNEFLMSTFENLLKFVFASECFQRSQIIFLSSANATLREFQWRIANCNTQ